MTYWNLTKQHLSHFVWHIRAKTSLKPLRNLISVLAVVLILSVCRDSTLIPDQRRAFHLF